MRLFGVPDNEITIECVLGLAPGQVGGGRRAHQCKCDCVYMSDSEISSSDGCADTIRNQLWPWPGEEESRSNARGRCARCKENARISMPWI